MEKYPFLQPAMNGAPMMPAFNKPQDDMLGQALEERERIDLTVKRLSRKIGEEFVKERKSDLMLESMVDSSVVADEIAGILSDMYCFARVERSNNTSELEDNEQECVWGTAIEMSVAMIDPSAWDRKPAHYGLILKDNEIIPQVLRVLLSKILEMNKAQNVRARFFLDFCNDMAERLGIKELPEGSDPDGEFIDMTGVAKAIIAAVNKMQKISPEKQKQARETIRTAKKAQDELQKQKEALDKERRQAEQTIEKLKAEIANLRKANKELDSRNRKLEKELQKCNEVVAEELAIDDISEAEDLGNVFGENKVDYSEVELPQKNVIFVGGHSILLNKLNRLFPKWRFISTEDINSVDGKKANPECIFVWYNHLSHKLFEKVRTEFGKDIIYLESTNIDKLILEMKEKYAKSKED